MTDRQERQFSQFRVTASGAFAVTVLLLIGVMTTAVAQAQVLSNYAFTALYDFTGGNDGQYPVAGLIQDSAGNLYGTTIYTFWGVVFEVSTGGGETVLYSFCTSGSWPCPDGAQPSSTLVADSAGNLYGTASYGGANNAGVVFELSPAPSGDVCPSGTYQGNGWCETVLYSFTGAADGSYPVSKLILDSTGNLYGTTQGSALYGGSGSNVCGSVFELSPSAGGAWTENTLHDFPGLAGLTPPPGSTQVLGDGCYPAAGLVMDSSGNLYGVTEYGGFCDTLNDGCFSYNPPIIGSGAVYELSPGQGGAWTETVLYRFGLASYPSDLDGAIPESDLIFSGGSLYGTASGGGVPSTGTPGQGTVFQLSPSSGGTWTESTLYTFTGGTDGCNPYAGVTADSKGNLYGTTYSCGNSASDNYSGSVYELSPPASGNTWTETTLYDFLGDADGDVDGANPSGVVFIDAKGNLYGTSSCENCSYLAGSVWELSSGGSLTTITVTSTPNPSTYGQSVTFTATIASTSGQVEGRTANRKGRAANRKSVNLRVKAQDLTGSVSWSANTGCGTTPVTSGPPATATCTTSRLNAGLDTVTAGYNGDVNDNPGKGTVSQTVFGAAQQINVLITAPASAIDGSSFTVEAVSESGSPVQISTSGACTGTGTAGSATITMTSADTKRVCDVTFFAAAAGNYQSATLIEKAAVVKSTKPTVSFTSSAPPAVYQSTFTVTATTNASTIANITVVPPDKGSAPCELSGSTVNGTTVTATVTMISGKGECELKAQWAEDTTYSAATARVWVTAQKQVPEVSFTGAPASADYGTSFTVTATSNETGNETSVPAIRAAGSCTVGAVSSNGPGSYQSIVTMKTKGTAVCTTTARWAANRNYAAASAPSQTTTPASQQ